MANFYAILTGSEYMKPLDCVESFDDLDEAHDYADKANESYRAEYDCPEDYDKDENALVWIVVNSSEAEEDYPDLKRQIDEFNAK